MKVIIFVISLKKSLMRQFEFKITKIDGKDKIINNFRHV